MHSKDFQDKARAIKGMSEGHMTIKPSIKQEFLVEIYTKIRSRGVSRTQVYPGLQYVNRDGIKR